MRVQVRKHIPGEHGGERVILDLEIETLVVLSLAAHGTFLPYPYNLTVILTDGRKETIYCVEPE